ncbi:carbohydrate-binding protein [Chitinophaga oryziterrae]|uniref:Carbohydrate-binding protein n=1 Tax=Chitinophaga oryziterrae TaxID=1031224 RepID=A0A6N8JB49_9BACT|nr:carbohydrate-binding protein [Chitinophaga oryziterrae]MVT41342.1 carbohydrate-binding protein [Chitinophaga oryziterrae]
MKKKNLLLLLLAGTFSTTALKAQTPPATWQEHWFEHNQLLTRVFYDNDLALYYDSDVSSSVTWPQQYLGDVWRYTKRTYGFFGDDPHLFAVFHTNKYSGGHPSGYFDASHDNRDVIDVGPGPWSGGGNDYDLTTHEVAHIVEGDSKNAHGSPAFGIWGDSKWAEIFIYDVYVNLGRTSDATRWYNLMMASSGDNFPRAGTKWFKDWFYPIYNSYGGNKVLNRYFVLLSTYFPKSGSDYSRGLNMGEFVHFWSAAAGVNLKAQATTAFGWTGDYESQFVAAQAAFPIAYATPDPIVVNAYQDINYGGYGVALPVGSYNLAKLKAYGAKNDDFTSLKVAAGYKVVLYADDNFTGASTTITSDVPLLDVATWNDKVSSLIISANGTAPVSTLIQAENYTSMAGVITEATTDTDGGSNVGSIDTGDWLAFNSINFPTSGTYKVEYRVASLNGGAQLSLDLNAGTTVLGYLNVPSTGGWQNWTTISHNVTVTAGTYALGVYAQTGGFNVNWIRITKVADAASAIAAKVEQDAKDNEELVLYPNPVAKEGTLTINVPKYNAAAPVQVSLVDLNKRVVSYKKANAKTVTLSTHNVSSGFYVLIVTNGTKQYTKKVLIQ